jgi:hypothetical protein
VPPSQNATFRSDNLIRDWHVAKLAGRTLTAEMADRAHLEPIPRDVLVQDQDRQRDQQPNSAKDRGLKQSVDVRYLNRGRSGQKPCYHCIHVTLRSGRCDLGSREADVCLTAISQIQR